eukprot:1914663-Pleurochrysis_carterae.AAC.1
MGSSLSAIPDQRAPETLARQCEAARVTQLSSSCLEHVREAEMEWTFLKPAMSKAEDHACLPCFAVLRSADCSRSSSQIDLQRRGA